MKLSETLMVSLAAMTCCTGPLSGQTEISRERVMSLLEDLDKEGAREHATDALARAGSGALGELLSLKPQSSVEEGLVLIHAAGDLIPYIDVTAEELEAVLAPFFLGRFADAPAELRKRLVLDAWRVRARLRTPNRAKGPMKHDSPIEDLERGLRSSHGFLRELAADLLARRGPEAQQLLPRLLSSLWNDPQRARIYFFDDAELRTPEVRSIANAVLALSKEEADCISAHSYRLIYGLDEERVASAAELVRLGPRIAEQFLETGSDVLSKLVSALDDPNPVVVRETITVMGIIGRDIVNLDAALHFAAECIPVLEQLVQHPDPQIAERAKAALRQMRGR